jgi:hypothetical protein
MHCVGNVQFGNARIGGTSSYNSSLVGLNVIFETCSHIFGKLRLSFRVEYLGFHCMEFHETRYLNIFSKQFRVN